MDQKVICIDFDGVVHKYSKGWQDGSIYDDPVPDAKEKLGGLVKKGYKIIIMTTRLNPELNSNVSEQKVKIQEWLTRNGLEEGVHYHEVTAVKPKASVYIDDRALRFTNWLDISKYFS